MSQRKNISSVEVEKFNDLALALNSQKKPSGIKGLKSFNWEYTFLENDCFVLRNNHLLHLGLMSKIK